MGSVASPQDSDLCHSTSSCICLKEAARPSSRTSPSTCGTITYRNRSDTPVIVPGCGSAAIRCSRACVTFWNPTGLARPARLARSACVRAALLVTCRDIPVRAGRLVEPTRAWCPERDCFHGLGAIAGRESRCARAS